MKTEVVQKAIVLSQERKMLLLRRSETDVRRPLQWDLPGGLLEDDEQLEDGVKREINEESGLTVDVAGIIYTKTEVAKWIENNVARSCNTVRIYYLARATSDQVELSFEHSEFCWVSLEEAFKLLEYPRHKVVLQHILDNSLEL